MEPDLNCIRTEANARCYVCGQEGKPLYEKIEDHQFGVPGLWSLKRCGNPSCGLVWLDPRPVLEDIHKLYAEYYTHSVIKPSNEALTEKADEGPTRFRKSLLFLASVFGKSATDVERFVAFTRKVRSRLTRQYEEHEANHMWLTRVEPGRLLDVGCGSGSFLKMMRDLSWVVTGVEVDINAVAVAREEFGLNVLQSDLFSAKFEDNFFDAVTLGHVIEHVSDPAALLRECKRVLKPGGKLVITTPNIKSLGHRLFCSDWRGLEPPRHFHIFSNNTLEAVAIKSGLYSVSIHSTSRLVPYIWDCSVNIKRCRTSAACKSPGRFMANMFHRMEFILCHFLCVGEEICLIAIK